MHDLTEAEKVIADLYKPFIEKLRSASVQAIYLQGGRGMGKTSILKRLMNRLEEESPGERDVLFLSGRDWEATRGELARHAEDLERGGRSLTLLLDDLDQLILFVALFKDEALEETLLSFMKVAAQASQNGRLILSATLPQTRLLVEVLDEQLFTRLRIKAFSMVLQQCDARQLEPWNADWRGRVGDLVAHRLPGVPKNLQSACREVVVALTGGHPSLLTWALPELAQLVESSSILGGWLRGGPCEKDPEKLLRRHLEDHLSRRGMVPLQRAIGSLKVEAPEAYADLKSLAREQAANRVSEPPPLKVRGRLLDEGLIYDDPATGRYVIPGDLLEQELLQRDELDSTEGVAQPAPTGPYLDPDPDFHDKRGYLVLPEEGRLRRLLLSGGPWSILTLLFENPGRTFSLEELTRGPLNSPKAVRSAIQRLEGRLRDAKTGKIIENVYGQGYRLAREQA